MCTNSPELREGMTFSEAAKTREVIETFDGRTVDSSGRPVTDGSGNVLVVVDGVLRKA